MTLRIPHGVHVVKNNNGCLKTLFQTLILTEYLIVKNFSLPIEQNNPFQFINHKISI